SCRVASWFFPSFSRILWVGKITHSERGGPARLRCYWPRGQPQNVAPMQMPIFFAPSSCHGSHLAEHIQHFVMNETVAGYAFLAVDGSRLTFEVCDAAGRLPDHQISGRAIPRAEFQLPESVEATRGDVAQVQRRRTRSPHRLRAQGEFAKIIRLFCSLVRMSYGNPVARRLELREETFETRIGSSLSNAPWPRCAAK